MGHAYRLGEAPGNDQEAVRRGEAIAEGSDAHHERTVRLLCDVSVVLVSSANSAWPVFLSLAVI